MFCIQEILKGLLYFVFCALSYPNFGGSTLNKTDTERPITVLYVQEAIDKTKRKMPSSQVPWGFSPNEVKEV